MMENKDKQLGLGFGPGSRGERQEALRQTFGLCMGMWKLLEAERKVLLLEAEQDGAGDTEREQLVNFSLLVFRLAIPSLDSEMGISKFMRPFLSGRMPDEEMVERRFISLI
ncbi:MAG: hypothetical protein LBB51_00380, partial [Zoogloeaceae bacterium]|nr:hypothetical protein [Zoogloeaceae bacterium]